MSDKTLAEIHEDLLVYLNSDESVDPIGYLESLELYLSAAIAALDTAELARAAAPTSPSEPVPSTPRVWAMPEIPKDVKTLRDNEGVEWRRVEKPYPLTWEDVHGNWRQERSLLLDVGPLTEVEETNDAD